MNENKKQWNSNKLMKKYQNQMQYQCQSYQSMAMEIRNKIQSKRNQIVSK